jgi:hypothetical protein
MNIFDMANASEAKIRYLDADYQVLAPGAFVRCAVTGKPIPLDELKYWSVARQEPYVDVETSLKRELEFMNRG